MRHLDNHTSPYFRTKYDFVKKKMILFQNKKTVLKTLTTLKEISSTLNTLKQWDVIIWK